MLLLYLPSVRLLCCGSFVGFSLNCAFYIIIKGVAIWGVGQPYDKDDEDEEIFTLPTLGSPVCVIWHWILFRDVGYSSSRPFDPVKRYLFRAHDVSLCVESEAMCEFKWKQNVTITSDYSKHHCGLGNLFSSKLIQMWPQIETQIHEGVK